LIREETSFDASDLSISPNARRLRWDEILKDYKGRIDAAAAMKFIGDHYDTWRKKEKTSALTLFGKTMR